MNLSDLVDALPEVYQPIFGHPELSTAASRPCEDRLTFLASVYEAMKGILGRDLRVLDLGCAQGFFSFSLAALGARVHGVDFLKANIALCQALAARDGHDSCSFQVAKIEEILDTLEAGRYDLVLGLSVFHHIVHERGADYVRDALGALAPKIGAGVFEIARADEPLYWAQAQPSDPRTLLEGFAFVHEIAQQPTHLSQIARPLYFASGQFAFLDGQAEIFSRWTTVSNDTQPNTHQDTRRFYFSERRITKLFDLRDRERAAKNRAEWESEIRFLTHPPVGIEAPALHVHGANASEVWLSRDCIEGETLDRVMAREKNAYDPRRVVADVLDQLVALEAAGLYHRDLRLWNVLVRPDGSATLIDFGAIMAERGDETWPRDIFLSFLVFLREVFSAKPEAEARARRFPNPDRLEEPYRRAAWAVLGRPSAAWTFAGFLEALAVAQAAPPDAPTPSALLARLEDEHEIQRHHISEIETWSSSLEAELKTERVALTARDAKIKRLNSALALANAKAKSLFTWGQADGVQSRNELAQRDVALGQRNAELSHTHDMLMQADAKAKSLGDTLASVYASTSWRITAPARFASAALGWFLTGVRAWITLKPGSRPRRLARRGVGVLAGFVQARPRLLHRTKQVLRHFPALDAHLRKIAAARITGIGVPPADIAARPSDDPLSQESREVRLAFQRLDAAGKANPDARPPSARPRLAYVSPLPPEQTGIADYSLELLPALAAHYEIDAIVAGDPQAVAPIEGCAAIHGLDHFEANAHGYDRIVYHIGNSTLHHHMLALLESFPGVVVLHDFYLGNLLAFLELEGGWGDFWTRALQHAHGYGAVKLRFEDGRREEAMLDYPANLFLIEQAQGVIVHSEFSRALGRRFYGADFPQDWAVVPHMRRLPEAPDRLAARQALGIAENDFLVCSFGFLWENKLNHRLLEAWLSSCLASRPDCHLVFVGKAPANAYGERLHALIRQARGRSKIHITGYASQNLFRDYLAAADLAVQLRNTSRGESSGTVLDCMAYGLPLIVNAHGAASELPDDGVLKLDDDFGQADLVAAIEALEADPGRRAGLGQRAREIVATDFAPERIALRYRAAIEAFALAAPPLFDMRALAARAAGLKREQADRASWIAAARALVREAPPPRPARQLLVDISAMVRVDLWTGIQRVVRAQLLALLENPPQGYRVEPVFLAEENGHWRLRYARRFTARLMEIAHYAPGDDPVYAGKGDIYYMPDYFNHGVAEAAADGLYERLREDGVAVNFLLHDNLPLIAPDFFPPEAEPNHRDWLKAISAHADRLICISRDGRDQTRQWLKSEAGLSSLPELAVLHHGADIDASAPTKGLPESAGSTMAALSARPTFLMVGTIEPRKGYLQTLAAFDLLWGRGVDANLVIVGAEGWTALPWNKRRTIPEIASRLRQHRENDERLFWLEGISDQYLDQIYAGSTCLLVASEGEGFGLPLIEAARHKLPILSRNVPVFQEVAGEHAAYFEGLEPEDLAKAITDWLALHARGAQPKSEGMPFLTWKENVQQLKAILLSA